MEEFISTELAVLISILCRKMPELLKYILQYSTTSEKNKKSSLVPSLSPEQIQEARLHPSAIIAQALRTITTIQNSLNTADSKLAAIAKQRDAIKAVMNKLQSQNRKGKT